MEKCKAFFEAGLPEFLTKQVKKSECFPREEIEPLEEIKTWKKFVEGNRVKKNIEP